MKKKGKKEKKGERVENFMVEKEKPMLSPKWGRHHLVKKQPKELQSITCSPSLLLAL